MGVTCISLVYMLTSDSFGIAVVKAHRGCSVQHIAPLDHWHFQKITSKWNRLGAPLRREAGKSRQIALELKYIQGYLGAQCCKSILMFPIPAYPASNDTSGRGANTPAPRGYPRRSGDVRSVPTKKIWLSKTKTVIRCATDENPWDFDSLSGHWYLAKKVCSHLLRVQKAAVWVAFVHNRHSHLPPAALAEKNWFWSR